MNFAGMTTDDLLAAIPPDEDNRWEFKSAAVLENKEQLKKVLGKQVSALANSGGGYLVFGISDDRQIEPCVEKMGRQSMKDYLSTMVEQSVEYPLQTYSVHRVPLTTDQSESAFVIVVEDSPAAPHQSKDERQYYYRIDGHSKPAPHFHIELLRNRITRTVLSVSSVEYDLYVTNGWPKEIRLVLCPTLTNISMQSTNAWGVLINTVDVQDSWYHLLTGKVLSSGVCINDSSAHILPHESTQIQIDLRLQLKPSGDSYAESFSACLGALRRFNLDIYPVSHNAVGKPFHFDWSLSTDMWEEARQRFIVAFPSSS